MGETTGTEKAPKKSFFKGLKEMDDQKQKYKEIEKESAE